MTPFRVWLAILTGFFGAFILGFLAKVAIRTPSYHVPMQMPTWIHFFPAWYQIFIAVVYCIIWIALLLFYSRVLKKSWQTQQRLKEFEKSSTGTYFACFNLKIQRRKGMIMKTLNIHRPEPVALVSMITENGDEFKSLEHENEQVEKISQKGSIVKKVTKFLSQTRAALYVLILTLTLWLTMAPFGFFFLKDMIYHIGRKDSLKLPNSTLNNTILCVQKLVLDQYCALNDDIHDDNLVDFQEDLQIILHNEETVYIEYITGVLLPLFNSMLNPILYALWYSEFRKYFSKFIKLFGRREEDSEKEKIQLEYVKDST